MNVIAVTANILLLMSGAGMLLSALWFPSNNWLGAIISAASLFLAGSAGLLHQVNVYRIRFLLAFAAVAPVVIPGLILRPVASFGEAASRWGVLIVPVVIWLFAVRPELGNWLD